MEDEKEVDFRSRAEIKGAMLFHSIHWHNARLLFTEQKAVTGIVD
jgi:hypothetical protein